MAKPTSQRVQKHRDSLRAAGMRPMQIWVPDTQSADFALECRRQSYQLRNDPHEADVHYCLQAAADTECWK